MDGEREYGSGMSGKVWFIVYLSGGFLLHTINMPPPYGYGAAIEEQISHRGLGHPDEA